jgi:hypothetical protein
MLAGVLLSPAAGMFELVLLTVFVVVMLYLLDNE